MSRSRVAAVAVGIFLLAVAVRVVHYADVRPTPLHDNAIFLYDAKYYDEVARRIVSGRALPDEPYFMAPLYPYVLAANYRLVGGLSPAEARDRVRLEPEIHRAAYAQCVLGGLTCVLLFLLARRLADDVAGTIAGLIAAFYGVFIAHDGFLMATQLIVLLNVAALFAVVCRRWALAGVLLGLCVLAHPTALLLLPALAVWIVLDREDRWRRLALVCGIALAVVLPATIRNVVVSGEPVLVSSNSGLAFHVGNGPGASGAFRQLPPELRNVPGSTLRWQVEALAREAGDVDARAVSRRLWSAAFDHVRRHPLVWCGVMWTKARLFWNAVEVGANDQYAFYTRYSRVLRHVTIGFGVVAPVGLAGLLLVVFGDDRRRWAPLAIWLGVQMLAFVGFFVTSRYRLVAVACLIVLASAWLSKLWTMLSRGRALGAGAMLVPIALFAAFVHAPVAGFDGQRGWGRQFHLVATHRVLAGDFEEAARDAAAALEHDFAPWSRERGEFFSYKVLAAALVGAGRYAEAEVAAQEAAARIRALDDPVDVAREHAYFREFQARIESAKSAAAFEQLQQK